jgi:DNA replication protein DnaC
MLKTPTIEKLEHLKFSGMLHAWQQQEDMPELQKLDFDERFGLLVDAEFLERENIRLSKRLQSAKLRQQACLEDISFKHARGLDRSLIAQLANCSWIKQGFSLLITGPTGVGKSYITCALANKACREGFTVSYQRAPRFFQDLTFARLNGSYNRLLAKFAKISLLILDDFALTPIADEQCRDLLEVVDDRCNRVSTIFSSQLPLDSWHKTMENPTIADAILDRVVHSSYKISLTGASLRKKSKGDNNKEFDE